MKKFNLTRLIERYCILSGKWAVVIHLPEDMTLTEMKLLAPFVDADEDTQSIFDGIMFVICDTEKECDEIFVTFEHKGPIYAYTVNSDGVIEDENT